jgi:CBS domain containing-hemolysin-like protein
MTGDPTIEPPNENAQAQDEPRTRRLMKWMRALGRGRGSDSSIRETIEELIAHPQQGGEVIEQEERTLLRNILRLKDVTAADVMVPRADIVAVELDTDLPKLVRMILEEAHSRFPVYQENLDHVVGMVHIKDVLPFWGADKPFALSHILRRVLFVAPSVRVLDLLLQMRETRLHMALVVDEFGGIDGLVTIEDMVEEVVGEIEDEHDLATAPQVVEGQGGSFVADARLHIEEFEERTGRQLTEEERETIDTLGGLVVKLAGRVPTRGELVNDASGLEFEVMEADPRRVKRVRVRRTAPAPQQSNPPEVKRA